MLLTDFNVALAAALLYIRLQRMLSKKSMLLLNALGFFLMNLYYSSICTYDPWKTQSYNDLLTR
jgi:hypothetical protein